MTDMKLKPKLANSESQKQLDVAEQQLDAFESNVKELTMDRMNTAPKKELEEQTKLSQKDLEKSKDIYLKPKRIIGCHPKDKFNEDYRAQYNFDKEYVHFIAENKEIIGETITMWTRPYGGMPAEEWEIPCNKPLWAPRYVAEQLKSRYYHRLVMKQDIVTGAGQEGHYYGAMAADTTIQRLDAIPVSSRKSVFVGTGGF
jgi:hypothetical protein